MDGGELMTATRMKKDTGDVITLEQSYSTPATLQRTCKKCTGTSPFHWPGCPDDQMNRSEVQHAVYRRGQSQN